MRVREGAVGTGESERGRYRRVKEGAIDTGESERER